MTEIKSSSEYFTVGGSLKANASSYVKRAADSELIESLLAGKFCYVLNSRQTGKSSLLTRTKYELEKKENFICIAIDLNQIGISGVSIKQWYYSLMYKLRDNLELDVDLENWEQERPNLSPGQYLVEFFEKIVLTQRQENIFIFIDEIDTVLGLKFSIDDFFALLRSFYNERTYKPIYNRLSFALFGVATPYDFIQDARRTPFNIGQAINLKGFQVEEIHPLINGLKSKAENPEAVIQEILFWTQGQPFLTQKICDRVLTSQEYITEEREKQYIRDLVSSSIIKDWETQDEPEHLRTIRDRVLYQKDFNDPDVLDRLALYQKILQDDEVKSEDSPVAMSLRLSGLVIEKNKKLKVYNPIYKKIFNQNWVIQQLSKHERPHAEQLTRHLESKNKDFPYLLYGKLWEEFDSWEKGKTISRMERDLSYESKLSHEKIYRYLDNIKPKETIINTVFYWTSGQKFLTETIAKTIAHSVLKALNQDYEQQTIDNIIQECIYKTDEQNIHNHFQTIEKYFLVNPGDSLLTAYEKILKNQEIEAEENEEYQKLQEIGLVVKKLRNLVIANRVYKEYFDLNWIEKIRLYGNKLHKWLSSDRQDNSLLLVAQELHDAIEWSKHKLLKSEDCQFFIVSQVWNSKGRQMNWHPQDEAGIKILLDFVAEIQESQKMNSPISLVTPILSWTDCEPNLTRIICQHIRNSDEIPIDNEEQFVNQIVETRILENWDAQEGAEHLKQLQELILSDENAIRLLKLYKQVIQNNTLGDNTYDLQETLLKLGLLRKDNERLKLGNRIYEKVFDLNWIETMLNTLKPYTKQLNNWLESNCQDDDRLLQGKDWKKAEEWAKNQKLSPEENLFLIKSVLLNQRREKNV
ncbi:MAG: AAA-like domain-containing protein [Cyanobacteria bacterium SBLK]|nr:AAA-like domain-containing protein [Cyanobacteria bacterium SBLK]